MVQNYYFIYNNNKYAYGTIILLKRFDYILNDHYPYEATFCFHVVDKDQYVCKIKNMYCYYTSTEFYNKLIEVTNKTDDEYISFINKRFNVRKKELSNDGMLIAWIWYVFIMAIAIIFKDMVSIWILASIIFFSYRKNKLKGGN